MARLQKNLSPHKRIISFFFLALMLALVAVELFATSFDASASRKTASSSVYTAPPNLAAIEENVAAAENLIYSPLEGSVLDIYYPETIGKPLPVILWIHGGGYIGGSKDMRKHYGMALANAGYVVANIDYALAPEQLYPGPIVQANAALEYLQSHVAQYGGDMSRIFVGGDSAGAQISSQLVAAATNPALAAAVGISPAIDSSALRGAILFCGLYNMETVRATAYPRIDLFLNTYTGTERFETFGRIDELSTVGHITEAYPPAFISAGDADRLASQSVELAEALAAKGIAVEDVFFDGTGKGLGHQYQFTLHTAEAQATLEKTLSFLSTHSALK